MSVTENRLIKSPVTNIDNVIFEEAISCDLIIKAYQRDYGINVCEYFAGINSVKIYKCLDTGYRFFFPFSLAGLSQLYEELQKQQGYYGLRREHQMAEAFFNANKSVLEIGCGSGLFMEKLQQKSIICTGLELNEEAVIEGRKKGLNILKEDVIQHSQENISRYDVVYCFQVLEHITKVHNFIQACLDALKVGGKFIVGVPNNNPFLYKYDKYHTLNLPPHHMGLWNASSLASLPSFFSMRLNDVLVEPLYEYEYEHYFQLQVENFKSQSKLLGGFMENLLLDMKPNRLRWELQKTIGRCVQGRNILAVYTKL